ncbi:hypothetical protein CK516_02350 [Nostoc sp. 'Peltigera malacea cyanobiont' DB3992]|nr:hypothetical protein CK516_02350 [Nostoc sp. 'Peltigera malacea cyanobiont' DB3992]
MVKNQLVLQKIKSTVSYLVCSLPYSQSMAGNRLWDSYANVDSEVAALVKVTVNIFAIVIEYKCFQLIPI